MQARLHACRFHPCLLGIDRTSEAIEDLKDAVRKLDLIDIYGKFHSMPAQCVPFKCIWELH